jgi:hypothetical protein
VLSETGEVGIFVGERLEGSGETLRNVGNEGRAEDGHGEAVAVVSELR